MVKAFLFPIFLCCCMWAYGQWDEVVVLNENWSFSQSGTDKWLPAEVPGTVHGDLLRHHLLPNPFYGTNEKEIQWVENEDWEYKTTFTVTAAQLQRDAAVLSFEGLDTYADVYLNGALILQADNMFVGYKIPVKALLREGINRLHICFRSPIRQTLPQWQSNGFDYPADNDHRRERLSVFTRKAPYSYGWDWGIRMVTSGIWRPVTLHYYNKVAVEDFHIRQLALTEEAAQLDCRLELQYVALVAENVVVEVGYALPGETEKRARQEVILKKGINRVSLPLEILSPRRWMPNGWGEPVLYRFTARVIAGGDTLADCQRRIGLRTVRVVKERDEAGETFYFEVNGIPMFAKGANYIPGDILLPAMTTERYHALFQDIKDANMNMIRVWGGGSYEDDRFYDLADENGILIWQDFMFACTTYPHDSVFLSRVKAEAEYNIRRLRNHACLAMWCGNNEILEGIQYWGWNKKYTPEIYEQMRKGYDMLFRKLLPDCVQQWDTDRFYMHGSPYFANWGRSESWKIADSHNWGVWYGRKPFESLDAEIPRFMSEFGFQSFPEMKTIAAFATPEDWQIESAVMTAHQKSSIGNDLIRTYMEREYRIPEKFEDFVYVGLVMQGRGIRHGVEAHRRNRPYCMGTLYWQLNDSWPVVSWSGIDYYGNWKALHYQARRAFAPLALDVYREEDRLQLWLMSDKTEDTKHLSLEMKLCDFKGKILRKHCLKTGMKANVSIPVWEGNVTEWVTPEQQKWTYLLLTLRDRKGQKIVEEPYFFAKPKELELPLANVSVRSQMRDGTCEVVLTSDSLAKDLFLEIPVQGARFSDNFFDLLPGEVRKIEITSPEFRKGGKLNLRVRQLRETYY